MGDNDCSRSIPLASTTIELPGGVRIRVEVLKYAKYTNPTDKSQGVMSPERPTGLVEGDRFDVSIGMEVVASKYFYHLPFYRQQDLRGRLIWSCRSVPALQPPI